MTSFVTSAKFVHDVESDLSYIEIVYDRYTKGKGYKTYTDYINAEPLGNWTLLESQKKNIQYEKFLDSMVTKTIEVQQRMAELILDSLLSYEQDDRTYIRITHAVKILDPTFQPPRVNTRSGWQMEFIKKFCKKFVPDAILMCTKSSRLTHFFNILRILELEQ
jgi:hypothetical protein